MGPGGPGLSLRRIVVLERVTRNAQRRLRRIGVRQADAAMAAAEAVRGLPRDFGASHERRAVGAVVEPMLLLMAAESGRALGDLVEGAAGTSSGTSSLRTSVNSTCRRSAALPSAMHQGQNGPSIMSSAANTGPMYT